MDSEIDHELRAIILSRFYFEHDFDIFFLQIRD